jgi:hypothetical protein
VIQEEIKRGLNSRSVCYYSVQKLLSSFLIPKNVKIRIYETISIPVVLYGCEIRSLTLREEHKSVRDLGAEENILNEEE